METTSTPLASDSDKPRVIICDTLMGRGVPFLEKRDKNHFIRVDENEWSLALSELDDVYGIQSGEK